MTQIIPLRILQLFSGMACHYFLSRNLSFHEYGQFRDLIILMGFVFPVVTAGLSSMAWRVEIFDRTGWIVRFVLVLPVVIWTAALMSLPAFEPIYFVGVFAVLSTLAEPLVLRRGSGLLILGTFEITRILPIIFQSHNPQLVTSWFLGNSSVVGLYALLLMCRHKEPIGEDRPKMSPGEMWRVYGAGLLAVIQSQAERIFLPMLDSVSRAGFAAVNTRVPVTTFLAESSASILLSNRARITKASKQVFAFRVQSFGLSIIAPVWLTYLFFCDSFFSFLFPSSFHHLIPLYSLSVAVLATDIFLGNVFFRVFEKPEHLFLLNMTGAVLRLLPLGVLLFSWERSIEAIVVGDLVGALLVVLLYVFSNRNILGTKWLRYQAWGLIVIQFLILVSCSMLIKSLVPIEYQLWVAPLVVIAAISVIPRRLFRRWGMEFGDSLANRLRNT